MINHVGNNGSPTGNSLPRSVASAKSRRLFLKNMHNLKTNVYNEHVYYTCDIDLLTFY